MERSTFLECESLDPGLSQYSCMTCRGYPVLTSSADNKRTDRTIIAALLWLYWKKKNIYYIVYFSIQHLRQI